MFIRNAMANTMPIMVMMDRPRRTCMPLRLISIDLRQGRTICLPIRLPVPGRRW